VVVTREPGLTGLLLDWYGRKGRSLPWRATRDPYAVLVSEIMLQQTQASRVVPAFRAFLERFPSLPDLAAAPLADVLTQWRGLGYNRRARNLHRAAIAIAERHGGMVPADLDALRALPGLGDYTARAILAFAFDEPAAPVDVNVARVLARAVVGVPLSRRDAQRVADEVLPVAAPAAWSHALMDLGATTCRVRAPRCGECPAARACVWRGTGGPDPAASGAVRSRPQARFAGSDRYHRGRLVDALRGGPVALAELPHAAQLADLSRLEALVAALVAEGLAERTSGELRLPGQEP
jgi:A/G-specific adenine glycosylase